MDNQIQKLAERIDKLEKNQIQAIMNNNADTNVVRSVQRILAYGTLAIGVSVPVSCALLELVSTTQGLVLPRMITTNRDAIANPVAGLVIYNTTTNKLNFYNGSTWEAVTSA